MAIKEFHRVLKKDGVFLMLETDKQGLEHLNNARMEFNLDPIVPPWHNKIIDAETFFPKIKDFFRLITEVNLGNYFFVTRLIHPIMVYPEKPSYDNKINKIAFEMADKELNFGKDFSLAKLYVLQKL